MENVKYAFFLGLILILAACKKEAPLPPAPEPSPEPVYVPIFEPGDTSKGAAHANKLTEVWAGSVFCKTAFLDPAQIAIQFFTYTSDGSTREQLILGAVPKVDGVGIYDLTSEINDPIFAQQVYSSYNTWTSDGDVTEDRYKLDSMDSKNHLTITKLDMTNRRIEGSFHASYNIQEPRINPLNPKKVTFSVGRFWATIRD